MRGGDAELFVAHRTHPIHQLPSKRAESHNELPQSLLVMAGVPRRSILQVRGSKRVSPGREVVEPSEPQRFQVSEMPYLLLDGPPVVYPSHEIVLDDSRHALSET